MEEEFALIGDATFRDGIVEIGGKEVREEDFWKKVDEEGRREEIKEIIDDVAFVSFMSYTQYMELFPSNRRIIEKKYRVEHKIDKKNYYELYKRTDFKIFLGD